MRDGRPRVVVIGAGFGGLAVVNALKGKDVQVTVVDRNNFHTFAPLLYQVATAALEPEEIAYPVRDLLRQAPNLDFRMASVDGIDLAARRVSLGDRGELEYDYLVLAAGSATSSFGIPGVEEHAYGLKSIRDATAMRSHVLSAFERATTTADPEARRRLMTIAVVGGGPTGVEMAGSLAELMRSSLRHDYPNLPVEAEAKVVLIEATGALLSAFSKKLQRAASDRLRKLGVDIRYESAVAAVTAEGVEFVAGDFLPAATVVWVAGVRAGTLAEATGLPRGPGGRVVVEETLQVAGVPGVYVVGDMAALATPHPMLAPVALQQGRQAAANILRQQAGRPLAQFRYKDRGTMATIGRSAAVAKIGPLQFSGFLAWVLWLSIHLVWLIGFRNRVLVLTNWAWGYLLNRRGVRLIMPPPSDKEL